LLKAKLAVLLAILFLSASRGECALSGALTTSFGYTLAPEDHAVSFSAEPDLFYDLPQGRQLELYAFVDRPTDPYKNFAVPKIVLTGRQPLTDEEKNGIVLAPSLSALDLDHWKRDGYRLRLTPALEWTPSIGKVGRSLAFLLRAGPYGQLAEYRETAEGREIARFGFTEKAAVGLTWERLYFEVDLVFDQRVLGNGTWKNDYSTLEKVTYRLGERLAVGVSHALLGSVVDETTGYIRPFRLWNERESRVSALVEYDL
jgi:hypothetical protein